MKLLVYLAIGMTALAPLGQTQVTRPSVTTPSVTPPSVTAPSVTTPSVTTPTVPSANSQQSRMVTCNATATSQKLAGDARKTFMSDCLAGKTTTPAAAAPAAPMTPQQRMTACNAQASDQKLAGDARKTFMSTCLKGSS